MDGIDQPPTPLTPARSVDSLRRSRVSGVMIVLRSDPQRTREMGMGAGDAGRDDFIAGTHIQLRKTLPGTTTAGMASPSPVKGLFKLSLGSGWEREGGGERLLPLLLLPSARTTATDLIYRKLCLLRSSPRKKEPTSNELLYGMLVSGERLFNVPMSPKNAAFCLKFPEDEVSFGSHKATNPMSTHPSWAAKAHKTNNDAVPIHSYTIAPKASVLFVSNQADHG